MKIIIYHLSDTTEVPINYPNDNNGSFFKRYKTGSIRVRGNILRNVIEDLIHQIKDNVWQIKIKINFFRKLETTRTTLRSYGS